MITDELLIQMAGTLAALYGLSYLITYARDVPISIKLTIAAQVLLLSAILSTYTNNNLFANLVFIAGILMTMTTLLYTSFEIGKISSSLKQARKKFVSEVFA